MAIKVSGFSFVHNAIIGGYPIVEAIQSVNPCVNEMVVVDCQSDDGTRDLLQKLDVRIIDGQWGSRAGQTLQNAYALHRECKGNIIIHFEADEVYDRLLVQEVRRQIDFGATQMSVYRLQLEQNFQRCRWYPEKVHRIFEKGSVKKEGHTTDYQGNILEIPAKYGYLWDITNCFRDNWLNRYRQQAILWNEQPSYRRVPLHFLHSNKADDIDKMLEEEHWQWTETPFNIPDCLKLLVGQTRYEVNL